MVFKTKYNNNIEYISIGNNISDGGLIDFCNHISTLRELNILSFATNKISDKGIESFSRNLYFITKLEKLSLFSI